MCVTFEKIHKSLILLITTLQVFLDRKQKVFRCESTIIRSLLLMFLRSENGLKNNKKWFKKSHWNLRVQIRWSQWTFLPNFLLLSQLDHTWREQTRVHAYLHTDFHFFYTDKNLFAFSYLKMTESLIVHRITFDQYYIFE